MWCSMTTCPRFWSVDENRNHLQPGALGMILVTTVWHSGTHSLMATLDDYFMQHCCPAAVERAKSGEYSQVLTTYRDPKRVAASWANRGRINDQRWDEKWRIQWTCYGLIRPHAEVVPVDVLAGRENSVEDRTGLHAALDAGDMDKYWSIIDRDWIELAEQCCG